MTGPVEKLQFLVKVAGDARLTASDLRCATVITDLYNATKQRAWPSYSRLISATHLSRATVARSVKHLHELSIITKEPGGKGRSNSYRPSFGLTGETVSPATPDQSHPRDGVSHARETRSYYSSCEDTSEGMSNSNPSSGGAAPGGARPAAGAPGGGDHPTFAAFFAAYPKREGRVAASKAYSAALGGGTVTPEQLLDGCQKVHGKRSAISLIPSTSRCLRTG